MTFALQFNRTFYDSTYLALAEHLGCEFWTADGRFYNAVKDSLSFVKWLAHYQPLSPLPSAAVR